MSSSAFCNQRNLTILLATILMQACQTQPLQTNTPQPVLENRFEGELDYSNGAMELVQYRKNVGEIPVGRIDEKGRIHLDLPEYDIRALAQNADKPNNFETQFGMVFCKGKGEYNTMAQPLFETPYNVVHAEMYRPTYAKKHGASVAYISMASDREVIAKGNFNKVVGSRYYWMYLDRAVDFKGTCVRDAVPDTDLKLERTADMQLKKGWNLIKSSVVEVQNYGENDAKVAAKKIVYSLGSPESKDVKWYLERRLDDDKILAAKAELDKAAP